MAVTDAGPQNEFTDDQTYKVDITKLYQDFIGQVDALRSHVSVQNNPNILKAITSSTTVAPTNLTVDKDPQESRCSAFYRLLGLPVTDGSSLYSPGMDIPNNSDKSLLKTKLSVAKSVFQVSGIKDLFDARENIPRAFTSIFTQQGVDSMVLSMTLADVRDMNAASTNVNVGSAIDTKITNQAYVNKMTGRLVNTVTNSGQSATSVSPNRKHIIFPLIIDPRIDLNVIPKRNMLAVPFLLDKSQTQIADGVFLQRPYIEKVCRDRFSNVASADNLGTHTTDIINNIKNIPYIKDQKIIQKVFGASSGSFTSAQVQFANYLNSIRSMLTQLNDAVHKVLPVLAADPNSRGQAQFNWVPIPNKQGPEFGSTTRDLLSQETDSSNTSQDMAIVAMVYSQAIASINNKLNTLQAPDLGNYAFDNTEATPDQNSTSANIDLVQQQVTQYQNDRSHMADAANAALQTIEIVTGELSGLGLIDVMVICSALWIVKPSTLLSLLDDTAINRMINNAKLNTSDVQVRVNNAQVGQALIDLHGTVQQIYDVCQQLWLGITQSNAT